MTITELRDLVSDWDLAYTEDDVTKTSEFGSILQRLEYFGAGEWAHYLPADQPQFARNFVARLARWVANGENDAARQLLLRLALRVSFFSHDDFASLYQAALNGPVARWLIDQEKITLDTHDLAIALQEATKKTWFCPITNSMVINHFYKTNGITGIAWCPIFDDLARIDEGVTAGNSQNAERLQEYMAGRGLEYLVLLEDFVGCGGQAVKAIVWALTHLHVPTLFLPLIVCPEGAEMGRRLNALRGDFGFDAVLEIGPTDVLGPRRVSSQTPEEPELLQFEQFAQDVFERVAGGTHLDPTVEPYTPFGCDETGALVVNYSNTPDNTLPLIHHVPKSGAWTPIFPRTSRLGN